MTPTSTSTFADSTQIDELSIMRARQNLDRFVRSQAGKTADRLGFGWRPSASAPSSFDALQREFKLSQVTGLPLRVLSKFCELTIFCTPETNLALRFWHDVSHVEHGFSFEAEDELLLAAVHLEALRCCGYPARSLEHRLLHAETVGQVLCSVQLGRFPLNQRRFVIEAVRFGLGAAIETEAGQTVLPTVIRRTPSTPVPAA